MLTFLYQTLAILLTLIVVASQAAAKKFEFLTGEVICLDESRVVGGEVTSAFGGRHKLESLSIRLNSTDIKMTPDKLFNDDYYRDLSTFMKLHPESVGSERDGILLKVDVAWRPAAEVSSSRLIDLLIPGDGSTSLVVSKSIRDLAEPGSTHNPLRDIFLAICWRRGADGSQCQGRFPLLGFRAGYPLPNDWSGVIERDKQLRSELAALVKRCD